MSKANIATIEHLVQRVCMVADNSFIFKQDFKIECNNFSLNTVFQCRVHGLHWKIYVPMRNIPRYVILYVL